LSWNTFGDPGAIIGGVLIRWGLPTMAIRLVPVVVGPMSYKASISLQYLQENGDRYRIETDVARRKHCRWCVTRKHIVLCSIVGSFAEAGCRSSRCGGGDHLSKVV
jgi:hypothetical protein